MATWQHGNMASWHRGIMAPVSLRRRCPSWNGEPTVNADGEMSEIAEVELTRHRVVASSADTVRRCFRQILVPFAFSVWGSSGSIGHTLKANGTLAEC